jgi:asparagine synthase (glutamine-hydrolysing)
MSGLSAVFARTGRLVTSSSAAVEAAGRHRGGAHQRFTGDTIALATHTPPSRPGFAMGHRWVVAWTGPLADLDGLARRLPDGRAGSHWRGEESALVAALLDRFGPDVIADLVGPFALAAWNASDRELVVTSDPMGGTPLYVHLSADWCVVASELRMVLAHEAVPRALDEGRLAEHLVGQLADVRSTPYREVERLAPGEVLHVRPMASRRWTAWVLPEAEDRSPSTEEITAVLVDAVRMRLPLEGPVAVELSGGLDSSSIVGLAAHLAGAATVRAYSTLHTEPAADEQAYAAAAADHAGVVQVTAPDTAGHPLHAMEATWFAGDLAPFPDDPNFAALRHLAAADGCAVMLTGQGGDGWFEADPAALWDLVVSRRFVTAARAWRNNLGAVTPGALWTSVREGCVRPVAARRGWWYDRPDQSWLRPEWAVAVGLDERLRAGQRASSGRRPRTRRLRRHLGHPLGVWSLGLVDREAARAGLEVHHPYLDRRLAEWAVRVPDDERLLVADHRARQREAVATFVPEAVLRRPDKAEFSHVWRRALAPAATDAVALVPRLVERGWVDPLGFQAMAARALGDPRRLHHLFPLWQAVSVEALLSVSAPLERAHGAGPDLVEEVKR